MRPLSGFGQMPGGGKAAVVILWVLCGSGVCGSGFAGLVFLAVLTGMTVEPLATFDGNPTVLTALTVFAGMRSVIWTVARGAFAVHIPRRQRFARVQARWIELIGMGLFVLELFTLMVLNSVFDLPVNPSVFCTGAVGLALSATVILLLSTEGMRKWCDR